MINKLLLTNKKTKKGVFTIKSINWEEGHFVTAAYGRNVNQDGNYVITYVITL